MIILTIIFIIRLIRNYIKAFKNASALRDLADQFKNGNMGFNDYMDDCVAVIENN